MEPTDLADAKKICACIPFIQPDAGCDETMSCMQRLIAEIETLRAENASLRAALERLVYAIDAMEEIDSGEYQLALDAAKKAIGMSTDDDKKEIAQMHTHKDAPPTSGHYLVRAECKGKRAWATAKYDADENEWYVFSLTDGGPDPVAVCGWLPLPDDDGDAHNA